MLVLKHLKTLQHVSIIIQIIFRELIRSLLKSLNLKICQECKTSNAVMRQHNVWCVRACTHTHTHQRFWREFPSAPCLAGKENLMTARVSMLLKSRASRDMLPFSPCKKKRLEIRHMNRPLFPMTPSIPSTTSESKSG